MSPASSPAPAAADTRVAPGSADYRRISLALFLAGFSTFSLLYCVQPLLPLFAQAFSIGAAQSSLALSLSTGCLAVAILAASALSERLSRRRLMFVSMALAAALNLAAAWMPSWPGVLVARALEGLVLGGVPATAMAYLAEEIQPRGLGLSMGLYVGGTAFGGMVGRVGMSMLSDWMSWRAAMQWIGAIDIAVAIGFALLLPASRHFVPRAGVSLGEHVAQWRRQLAHPALPAVFAIGFLAMGEFVTIYNYAGFRLMAPPFSLDATRCGLIFSAYVFGIVASSTAGALADRFGRAPVIVAGVATSAAGVALTLDASLAVVIVGIALLTIGFFITHSVASSWVGLLAQGAKSYASALYLLAYYVGSSVLGSWGGQFWQDGGWHAVAAYALALLAAALACVAYLARAARRVTRPAGGAHTA
ncbi:MFS transporter [Burkholderia gladioli]|uniref:MFS transporter n=2 Tax=Burkholderia gladioli TaxID=28095 RepID=A0AAW7RBR0_BURGA|nr:MFS transporter [Burkholderia gladioli]AJX01060.1 sugar (and other) transporter family protein [Burkholderia gladioli]ASD78652.1 MFS transporter [Burkholderia gladioli pv. gladioli]AWY56104.1 MFS transporter [Burkholderia gladioli pv. gladioli]AYQ87887.1 MFS transporter [Burkholderia gladioli]KAF1064804.1 Inner membrane transport protein YnfM [Burkholderia gladioli]